MVGYMSYLPAISTGGYTPQEVTTASRSLASTGQTTVVNVTEAGIVEAVVIQMITAIGSSSTTGIRFTVDGGTPATRNVINGSVFLDWVLTCGGTGDGTVLHDKRILPISFPYSTSLKVEIDCSTATASAGVLQCTVMRSKKN